MAKDVDATSATVGYENVPSTPTTPKKIASKDRIPGWLRDNDYIINGHPMPTFSYRRSFRLWRCLHMETMNIWTHLVGASGFIATGVGLYTSSIASSIGGPSAGDRFAFGTSLTAAVVCFGLSTIFHTLRSHSYNVHHFWGKMDIFGICLLALGGGLSATFYAFYCNRRMQWIYWGLNVAAALGAAFTLFDTGGGGSRMRNLRGGVFSLLAVAAMLPILHGVGVMGWAEACKQIGVQWYLAEGISLLLGVGLFVGRLPERLSPGSFDILGHSHQLFHVAAVAGTAFHVKALSVGYQYRSLATGY
ncbi:hypothetical protein KVT40_003979 [Elsinoe batatas]|uniref:HlyIII-domain-containing protein n=1 Tax=Elsinoe batatas TaxID=2601811 RepID=A0A8K0L1E3_9PEZI|nr:hypothetical protein KVT40_003979 [Elsinoe batatas]